MEYKDYYSALNIARGASADEIQAAYRKLARKLHPDVDKSAGATKRFQELNEAYEVLKDPATRERYDRLGARWKQGEEFTPPEEYAGWQTSSDGSDGHVDLGDLEGFSSFFASMFGDLRAQRAEQAERAAQHSGGRDLLVELPIAPWEAALGASVPFRHPDGRQITLRVPAGSSSGRRLRLRGMGLADTRGRRGDMYAEVKIVVPAVSDAATTKLWRELSERARFDPRA